MRSIFRNFAVALATLMLTACATLAPPQPREFRLSQAQLQDLVGKRFEMARTYLGFLDVKLATPVVTLQPESNRVLTALDVSIDAPLIGKPWKGAAAISGRLRFDQAAATIMLDEPRAEKFTVEGVPAVYADRVNKIGGWLSEQVLKGFPIYTLKPEDLRFDNVSYSPSEFKVKPGELTITLVPKATQ
mgnify:CR=1 FL=1|jgi:hypothetical protein